MKEFNPKTLQEAIQHFTDEQVCVDTLARVRWLDGKPVCPACGHGEYYYLAKQRRFKCKECWKQYTVKMGTLLEDSPISLTKWLPALWMLVNDKNGISSYELSKALGITQKSAWFVLHRLRTALQNGGFAKRTKLGGTDSGPVEVEECFVGGKAKNMHRDRAKRYGQTGTNKGKTVVMGLLDRELRQVRAKVVPDVKRETLQAEVMREVKHGSRVFTDEHVGYDLLHNRFVHEFVKHTEQYVNGQVHTNGIENFWSLLKRTLNGTYVAVEPYHLSKYIDEQVFRFNNRGGKKKEDRITDAQRFELALSQVAGKRLTYAELTGKEGGTEPF